MTRLFLLATTLFYVFACYMTLDCPNVPGAEYTYYRPETGTCYYKWAGQVSYDQAKNTCIDNGLHMVRLEELDEQQWLATQTSVQHWLGLSKVSGRWKWIHSGILVADNDSRWDAGGTVGSRAYKLSPTKWAKTWPSSSYTFICELEPTSAITSTGIATTTTTTAITTTAITTTETTTTGTSVATLPASPARNGTSSSAFREFYLRKFTDEYLGTLRFTWPVKSILECGAKCINDTSCRGVRVVLHRGLCALLRPSQVRSTCPTDAECYQVVGSSNPV